MNYWIVSAHEFVLHDSCEGAQIEAKRLADVLGKPFHLYRVKNKLRPGEKPGRVATLVDPAEFPEDESSRPFCQPRSR